MNRTASLFARLLVGVLALGGLSACSVLPKRSDLTLFDPQPTLQADAEWPSSDTQLGIQRPLANRLIDGTRILVRPTSDQIQVYQGAAWVQSAPDMLHAAMIRLLADGGKLKGVSRRSEGVAVEHELVMEIRRFDADYQGNTDNVPQAVIEVSAQLLGAGREQVLAHKVFRVATPAGGTAIPDVVEAFEQSLAEVTRKIAGWSLAEIAEAERRKH